MRLTLEHFKTKGKITDYIPTGKENAVSLKTIMEQANIDEDRAKEWLRLERQNRVIVCTNNRYWIPNDPPTEEEKAEVNDWYIKERKQSMSRLRTVRFAKRWLAKNEKQLELNLGGELIGK